MASISTTANVHAPAAPSGRTAPRHAPHSVWTGARIFAVLFIAVLLEMVSQWVKNAYPQYPAAGGIISTFAILTLLSPGLYLIFWLRDARTLRYTMIAGSAFLLANQLVNLTGHLAALNAWPVLGNDSALHDPVRWFCLVAGLVLLLASLYFTLLTTIRAESQLRSERVELVNEVERTRRLTNALIEKDNVYRAAIAQAGAIPYRIDWASKTYTFFDDRIYALTGRSPDELTFDYLQSMTEDVRYIGPLAGVPADEVRDLIDNRAVRNWHREYKFKTKSGEERWLSDSSVEVVSPNGLVVETVGLMMDITERHREDEAIQRNERYFRALTENAQDLITVLNLDGTIRYESPSIKHILGYDPDELLGRNVFDLIHPDDRGRVLRTLLEGLSNPASVHRIEFRCKHADGSWHKLESIGRGMSIDSELDGAVINSRDITDRESLERQLMQSQKMEGIGRLAGGVAHDFNNLLTAIMGYCEFAMEDVPEDSTLHVQMEQILEASSRAADLTRQLLAFARKQIAEPRNVDLNYLTQNLEKMFRRLIGEDIELKTCTSIETPIAYVDPGQFEQVLVNLVINARDAMPQGGKLTIEIATTILDEEYVAYHPEVKAGEYVMLAVSDTGFGMTDDVRTHIFEPFFTTKEDGKGTGLGLAMCYGIVKQFGGHIWVYSEVDRGTTFKVYLPRIHGEAANLPGRRAAMPAKGGNETILLVEDESLVRSITVQTLVERGYTVLEAPGGFDAIEIAAKHAGPIHLLLTDVVMPKMSGREIAEQLKPRHEHLKVLYMSGYTEDAIVHQGELQKGIAFLPKPFTPEALARKVRNVLDQVSEVARA
ncbi:MAG: PAS domain S-box protein [Candidatus Hydrogenedentes bacterium]|nr:PAS domain S-box protein [Candidatus Hydrogenedentota bacterium]